MSQRWGPLRPRSGLDTTKDTTRGCADHDSERLRYDKESLAVGNAIVFLKGVAAGKDWPAFCSRATSALTVSAPGKPGGSDPSNSAWRRRTRCTKRL